MLEPSTLQWAAASHDTRPADDYGAAVTPAQNAKGAWATVMDGAEVLHDVWEIEVRINDLDAAGISRDALVDIGYDAGAGFQVVIPNLLASYAGPYLTGGALGITYRFRVHFPAGADIGARASVNSATLTAFGVSVVVAGDPEDASLHWKGAFVRALGAVEASSCGTAFSPGQAADGDWTELGTLAEDLYDWQLGVGADDSTLAGSTYHFDLGLGAAAPPTLAAVVNLKQSGTTAEQWNRLPAFPASAHGAAGDKAFARGWCSGAPDSTMTAIAYGTGGDGGNTDVDEAEDPPNPYLATTTTPAAIRDRMIQLIKDLEPTVLGGDRFEPSRNEFEGDFLAEATAAPDQAWRRYQVRAIAPDYFDGGASNTDVEERVVTFEVVVAYAQSHRAGDQNALDRDDAMDSDAEQIDAAVGRTGYGNFPAGSAYNATWQDSSPPVRVSVDGVDFAIQRHTYRFYRARTSP